MRIFLFYIFSFILFSFLPKSIQATVWDDVNLWNEDYEARFSHWIASDLVREDIFSNPSSPYFGIKVDCADTAYALRAIFAFENQLSFGIRDPRSKRKNTLITNRQNSYDHISSKTDRLIKMINDIGETVGTENLSHYDSYPISIASINPGSLFIYKIQGANNTFIRHTYIIKGVNDNGSFDVLYSTQSLKYSKLPLMRRKEKDFEELPIAYFGFKRFRSIDMMFKGIDQLPQYAMASNEQYEMAQKLDVDDFFKQVRLTHSKVSTNAASKFVKTFDTLCDEAKSRVEYVNQGVQYLKLIQNKCMNYDEYDSYSTPVKDSILKGLFQKLARTFQDSLSDGSINQIPYSYQSFYELIFEGKMEDRTELLRYCNIKYAPNKEIDLAELFYRINANLISSHPNDSLEARWGEDVTRTNCKVWY